jgi:putative membrane protein
MTTEPFPTRRLHVAAAFAEALTALRDVAFPLVISFVVSGPKTSTGGMIFGVVGAIVAAILGYTRWRATTYFVSDSALHYTSGVFSPDDTVVPIARVQAVDTVTGPIQRLFGVTGLHVQTPGGDEDGDVVLSALSAERAEELRAALGHPDAPAPDAHVQRLRLGGLLAAALTAPQLGVLLPVLGAAFGLLQQDGGEARKGLHALRGIDSTHEVVLIVAALIGVAFLVSFLGAVVAFSGFEVRLVGDRLRLRRGLFQRRAVSVPIARIDGVEIVAGPLRRPFGLVALRLEATSLGKREISARTLFPLLRARDVDAFLAAFVPDLAGSLALEQRPPRRALRRYLTVPLLAVAALSAILILLVPAAWPAAPVLLALTALVRIDAYILAGLTLDGPRAVARHGFLGGSSTLVLRRRRLQEHTLRRSPLQRRAGLATLRIEIARGASARVAHLEGPTAQAAFDAL